MDLTSLSKKWVAIAILVLVSTVAVQRSVAQAESDPFPLYPCIETNVTFWKKVFTEYSSRQGVIHDTRDLSRIYGIIDLMAPEENGHQEVNRQRIKKTKGIYKSILSKLGRGNEPVGEQEHHVARLFGKNAKPAEFRSAMGRLRCQKGLKESFREGLIRSGAYINEIKGIFRRNGVPQDLAYLPHVESAFNSATLSKRGATGIWQFIRSTGKLFMQVGYAVDERLDPMIATHAAANLLLQNYQKLNDWPMAITAYNHGANGMLRAKRLHGTYDKILKEYRSRMFGFASRNFYSEFLAARQIARNYHPYFGHIELDTPPRVREVDLAGYLPIQELMKHLNWDLEEIRKLNPALRQPIYNGQAYIPKGYRLKLPDAPIGDPRVRVSEIPDHLYRTGQKRSHVHTVQKGESAGEIARRHGVKLNALIAANDLDTRATIYVNQKIKIPPRHP